ncbi:flagellar FlbD family protein [Vagococcus hydrophili]|uniref:Flagellar FlbD family protein n=1 Tax=Vagococcus hydrophili TaxID=2714947 RepID=A0A6G8AWM1_9ENTE|nr:flagellar FlbD family protein [Vagococcus hydrophili]QIL49345.1 flagellar FlbD family protein [Vagococcus hydrophili]
MIKLTTMNNQEFYLNTALIFRIEQAPDTIITLSDGKTIMVKESSERVVNLFKNYQKEVFNFTLINDN